MTEYPRPKRRTAHRSIPATEAAKTFGRLVDRVRETRAIYIVERGGTPVAQIGPIANRECTVADLVSTLKARGRLDETYLRQVEAGVRKANKPVIPADPWKR